MLLLQNETTGSPLRPKIIRRKDLKKVTLDALHGDDRAAADLLTD